ncbi:molybdate ABC transporter permease subunit [Paenibacillus sp. UMB4589-SE434]|uniref:molybdate ABC transporter permease subunit n=1 Tax=Paenibacillus sp. UMB4589-SE434 TaxID=3046314 RepID=UPI002550B9D8|nr:molybdate ABC transporter permease subunit [Paenibacillus sp. UMB4589-SE434]MDK8180202.1 molybdate ABC transporter permease subunit [Paenibacillus sp. UMB4589-SE434]
MNMIQIDWAQLWNPIRLSLQVALIASILGTLFGVTLAWRMTRSSAKGKVLLETLFLLPLVLPPTVVGFLLLVALGRRSWIGQFAEWLFSAPIIFSWGAAVIASVVVSFPLVYQTMKTGFRAIDHHLADAARSIGASEWQVFRYITLPLAFPSIITAYILSFARSLGEFGATLMIAGNIPGKTQTVPTAIFVAVDSGNMMMAWLWTISMVVISFLLLLLTGRQRTSS